MTFSPRSAAVTELTNGNISDDALIQAREAHQFAYAEYVASQPRLAAASPPSKPQLYAPVTAENTLNNCCRNFLPTLGLEITYPEDAERRRQARAGIRPRP
jgi:hypothetical protein